MLPSATPHRPGPLLMAANGTGNSIPLLELPLIPLPHPSLPFPPLPSLPFPPLITLLPQPFLLPPTILEPLLLPMLPSATNHRPGVLLMAANGTSLLRMEMAAIAHRRGPLQTAANGHGNLIPLLLELPLIPLRLPPLPLIPL